MASKSMLRGAHGFGWKHVWAHGWGHSKRQIVSEGRPLEGSFGDPNSWEMNNLHEGNWLLRQLAFKACKTSSQAVWRFYCSEQGVNSYYCGWARCARLVCTFSNCNLWIPTILSHFEILRPLTLRDSIFPIHKGILLWSHIFLNVGEL